MTDTTTDLTALLERDYRRLLRWYPQSWRSTHGAAMLGTLMDEAEATDRFLLHRGEWRDFAAAGMAARLDRVVRRRVRDTATTVTLSMGVGLALVSFVTSSWAPWDTAEVRTFGPFFDAGPVLTLLWVLAFAAAQVDQWWLGRITLLLSVFTTIVMRPIEIIVIPAGFFTVDPANLGFLTACALLAVLGTPHRGLRLLGASAGWGALALTGSAIGPIIGGWAVQRSNPLLPLMTYYGSPALIDLAPVGVVALLLIARSWHAAFTILLATIPVAASVDAAWIWWVAQPWSTPPDITPLLLLNIPIAAGLVLLVCASRGTLRLPGRRGGDRKLIPPPRAAARGAASHDLDRT